MAVAAAGAIPGMRYAVQAAYLKSWTSTEAITTPELENSQMLIHKNRLALLLVGALAVCAAATANAGGIAYVGPRGGAVIVGRPAPAYVRPAPVYVRPTPVYVGPARVYVRPAPVYLRPAPAYVAPAPLVVVPRRVYVTPAPVVVTSAPIAIRVPIV